MTPLEIYDCLQRYTPPWFMLLLHYLLRVVVITTEVTRLYA